MSRNARFTYVISAFMLMVMMASSVCAESLAELWSQVKTRDPQLLQMRARLEAERESFPQAVAALLPRADITSGVNYFTHRVFNYPSAGNGEYMGYNYGISLRQPLVNGQAWKTLDQARLGIRAVEYGVASVELDAMMRTSEAYLTVLRAAKTEDVAKREKVRMEEILKQALAALQAGTGDAIAVFEARYRLAASQTAVDNAIADRTYAEQRLSFMVGKQYTREQLDQKLATDKVPKTAGDMLDKALETSPAVLEARTSLERAESEVVIARRGHWPTIDMIAGFSDNKGSTFVPDMEIQQWSIGASLTIPLSRGGATQSQLRQAVARRSIAQGILDEAVFNVRQRYSLAHTRWEGSKAMLASTSRQAEMARQTAVAVSKGCEVGVRTVIELMNAEQSSFAAERSYEITAVDTVLALLQANAATGQLSENDLKEIQTGN